MSENRERQGVLAVDFDVAFCADVVLKMIIGFREQPWRSIHI